MLKNKTSYVLKMTSKGYLRFHNWSYVHLGQGTQTSVYSVVDGIVIML